MEKFTAGISFDDVVIPDAQVIWRQLVSHLIPDHRIRNVDPLEGGPGLQDGITNDAILDMRAFSDGNVRTDHAVLDTDFIADVAWGDHNAVLLINSLGNELFLLLFEFQDPLIGMNGLRPLRPESGPHRPSCVPMHSSIDTPLFP